MSVQDAFGGSLHVVLTQLALETVLLSLPILAAWVKDRGQTAPPRPRGQDFLLVTGGRALPQLMQQLDRGKVSARPCL